MSETFDRVAARERMLARRIVFGKVGHVRVDSIPRGRALPPSKGHPDGRYVITMIRDEVPYTGMGATWRKAWESAFKQVAMHAVRANRKKGTK